MTRSSLSWIPALFLVGCAGSPSAPAPAEPAAAPSQESREFQFVYDVRIPAPPVGTRRLNVWVPLPLDEVGVQSVRDLQTWVNGEPNRGARRVEREYGNSLLHVAIDGPTDAVEIRWTARILRQHDVGQGNGPALARFLAPDRRIPVDGTAHELAVRLGVDDPTRPRAERAQRIFSDVLDGMDYDKSVPGYGLGDFERAITVCKGNCTDFHARFLGTARAGAIPARFTMGVSVPTATEGKLDGYHCWAHWHDGSRWRPVDISEADKVAVTNPALAQSFFGHLDPNRLSLSVGRDIILDPPQSGPPLEYFVFPYAESDGVPVALEKGKNWSFAWKDA